MTTIDLSAALDPALALRYTAEELAVIADLYELESLPGVAPIELTPEVRGLATRTLLARNILWLRDDGAIEVLQPHATFLASLFEAPRVLQVSQLSGAESTESVWFDWGNECVCVQDEDDGIIFLSAYKGAARDLVTSSLGAGNISDEVGEVEVDLVVDLVTTTRNGDEFVVQHEALGRCGDTWHHVHRPQLSQ